MLLSKYTWSLRIAVNVSKIGLKHVSYVYTVNVLCFTWFTFLLVFEVEVGRRHLPPVHELVLHPSTPHPAAITGEIQDLSVAPLVICQ